VNKRKLETTDFENSGVDALDSKKTKNEENETKIYSPILVHNVITMVCNQFDMTIFVGKIANADITGVIFGFLDFNTLKTLKLVNHIFRVRVGQYIISATNVFRDKSDILTVSPRFKVHAILKTINVRLIGHSCLYNAEKRIGSDLIIPDYCWECDPRGGAEPCYTICKHEKAEEDERNNRIFHSPTSSPPPAFHYPYIPGECCYSTRDGYIAKEDYIPEELSYDPICLSINCHFQPKKFNHSFFLNGVNENSDYCNACNHYWEMVLLFGKENFENYSTLICREERRYKIDRYTKDICELEEEVKIKDRHSNTMCTFFDIKFLENQKMTVKHMSNQVANIPIEAFKHQISMSNSEHITQTRDLEYRQIMEQFDHFISERNRLVASLQKYTDFVSMNHVQTEWSYVEQQKINKNVEIETLKNKITTLKEEIEKLEKENPFLIKNFKNVAIKI
jgi:hypothetical protein